MERWKKSWEEKDRYFKYTGWLYRYSRPYLKRIAFIMAMNFAMMLGGLALAIISKNIIDSAGMRVGFAGLMVMYLLLAAGIQVFSSLSGLLSVVLTERFSFGMRKQLYEQIINSQWMDVKRFHSGDLMTRLTSDAANVSDGIISTLPGIMQLMVELVLVFFTLFYYSRLLAVLALLIAPAAALTTWWMGKKLRILQVKVQQAESEYRSFLQESLENLLVVKAFAGEAHAAEQLTALRENRFYWVFKKTKLSVASSSVMSLSFQFGYILAFAYGAMQISAGMITYGTMSVFLTLVNRVQAPVMQLAQQIPRVIMMMASAERIMELSSLPTEEKLEQHIEPRQVGVEVKDLTFGYGEETVLEDVELSIRPGEMVAVVGESGIGKTTLVRLLLSFTRGTSGDIIYFDDTGRKERVNAGIRECIAYVPQGNTLFSGTIRQNIEMGRQNASEEEMADALKMAAIYDFIVELPDGLDTVIGERGHGLSEGQAQRIAIARALVRKAPILILDEATSALDEASELAVIQGIRQLTPRPTCLIITHRRSILKYCNRQIKIDNKKIQEIPLVMDR